MDISFSFLSQMFISKWGELPGTSLTPFWSQFRSSLLISKAISFILYSYLSCIYVCLSKYFNLVKIQNSCNYFCHSNYISICFLSSSILSSLIQKLEHNCPYHISKVPVTSLSSIDALGTLWIDQDIWAGHTENREQTLWNI